MFNGQLSLKQLSDVADMTEIQCLETQDSLLLGGDPKKANIQGVK